ncbi:MAG: iron ABC transporter permease [Clostridia bacterium]|nr:iron ABC transporter permease [Clostridia bacterium]
MKKLKYDRYKSALFYACLFFLLSGYILYPLLNTVMQAFHGEGGFTLSVFREYVSNPNHLQVIRNTALLGVGSVLCCGVLGSALAGYMTFCAPRMKRLLHIILLSPMMIPGVIIVIAFVQLYGESGIVTKLIELLLHRDTPLFGFSGLPGILFVITYTQYVYFYMNVSVALRYVDYSAVEAAASLGAGKWKICKDVILPTVRPALITSATMTFASGVGAFSAPNLIGGGFKVLSTQIVRSKANNYMDVASVQVLMLLLMSASVMLLLEYYKKRCTYTRAVRATPLMPQRQGSARRALFHVLMGLQVFMVVIPIAGILYMSFNTTHSIMTDIFPCELTLENFSNIFHSARFLKPLINSLKMSFMAVGGGLLLTVPVSYLSWRQRGVWSRMAKSIMLLPWCMPVSVIGVNMINAFNTKSIFAFGQALIGGFSILPIAYIIIALPLLLSANDTAMDSFNPVLEDASRSLGASPFLTVLRVVLPGIAPGIAAGGILVFIRTMGEYTVSALLYGVHNRPISISMVLNIHEFNIGVSMALGVIVIGISYVTLLLLLKLDKRQRPLTQDSYSENA